MELFEILAIAVIAGLGLYWTVFRKKEKAPVIIDNSGIPPYVKIPETKVEEPGVSLTVTETALEVKPVETKVEVTNAEPEVKKEPAKKPTAKKPATKEKPASSPKKPRKPKITVAK
jgi:hypothetical protein